MRFKPWLTEMRDFYWKISLYERFLLKSKPIPIDVSYKFAIVIFRQICKISFILLWACPFLGLYVSVFLCVTYFREQGQYISENQKYKNDLCRFWYLPSNGVIAKIVLRDIHLNFQRQAYQAAILTSKRWKMQTLLFPLDMKSGISHRLVPLRMLYIIPLTYIFKVTNFEMWISRKRWDLANISTAWLL